jgi:hypothetical protein
MNLTNTIIPKSDQLNADDLISGPRTIRITGVEAGSAEQPVAIHYEGGTGRPYKPSKSMRRVLVAIWGTDGNAYVGRSLTIYRDPLIKFGGDAVGGIRISHASDIEETVCIALTESRGKRKPFRVQPLVAEKAPAPAAVSAGDLQALIDVGDSKAREGLDALGSWWKSLPAGPLKVKLGAEKLAEWKLTAGA